MRLGVVLDDVVEFELEAGSTLFQNRRDPAALMLLHQPGPQDRDQLATARVMIHRSYSTTGGRRFQT